MIRGKFVSAVIVAGGSGRRMNSEINKPFLEINGKKIIEYTLDTLTSIEEFDEIILVIRSDDDLIVREIIKAYDREIKIVYGGVSREESTFFGLKALDKKAELVLTHDGVRPFASRSLFFEAIDKLKDYKAVITAVKSKDTVKIVDEEMLVDFTPNRDFVYNIQTPQAFDLATIFPMYEKYVESEFKITDDSQLFEFFDRDIAVKVIEGEYSNIKITTAEDILFARAYIETQKREI